VLGLALLAWFAPGVVGLVGGDESKAYDDVSKYADEGIVAVIAASLLFLLPIDWARRQFTLTWNQAKEIDWGTVLLFAGGIALGGLLDDTGLAKTVGESLADVFGVSTLIPITIVSVLIAVLICRSRRRRTRSSTRRGWSRSRAW
jgi:solute carrier family 13 (sodium-dependent dicarboxylate transporter), member 2/3/5